HVVMPMHGINAVEDGDAEARPYGQRLIMVVQVCPRWQTVARLRVGAAAAQERAEMVRVYVLHVMERVLLGLCHLPDLLFERHACEHLAHLRVEGGERFRRSATRLLTARRALRRLKGGGESWRGQSGRTDRG